MQKEKVIVSPRSLLVRFSLSMLNYWYTSSFIYANSLQDEIPETTIGKNVVVNGQLKFDRLVRIDGSFSGQLVSQVSLLLYNI